MAHAKVRSLSSAQPHIRLESQASTCPQRPVPLKHGTERLEDGVTRGRETSDSMRHGNEAATGIEATRDANERVLKDEGKSARISKKKL